MSATDQHKKIIGFVKSAKPRSTGHKVISQDQFLDGAVAKVEYQDDGSKISQYVVVSKKHSGYADTESQLIQQMNTAAEKNSVAVGWLNQIFNIGGIIALILVLTASYITIWTDSTDIPEYLKASLLTIIGFYFGGYIHQSSKKKSEKEG